jgi:proline iminopeptidase
MMRSATIGTECAMQVQVNGTTLWFDIEGSAVVPEGRRMVERPTLLLVHGGPGSYDHSYLKPWFGTLADAAQVVYVDLRDHGRSARHDPTQWSFEVCADDLAALCDALGLAAPIVLGHSMGGIVAMLLGARHPGCAGALVLQSTMARFDLDRLVAGFERFGGAEVAALAERDYSGAPVSDEEWAQVFAAFGPNVPTAEQLARRIQNPEVAALGMDRLRALDVVDQLARITCRTLVSVGDVDPVTPVAAAHEIVAALPTAVGQLDVIDGAGHFPWLDAPERYRAWLYEVVATAG